MAWKVFKSLKNFTKDKLHSKVVTFFKKKKNGAFHQKVEMEVILFLPSQT